MNSDDTNAQQNPNGSTDVTPDTVEKTEALADGSQSDASAPTDDDTASGGPAD
ncbi:MULTISPECIES: hypothetical protein [unclassified Cryobacterium]|uniref:hypothetical protein n=1 Tax=unclassified Cryobacterium TaxID=2649013 RepID=UPI002AB36057|nr:MULTISPECIES: hypothetical protein [unclassified Cryobacterium]MDY7543067.1 hypothetical protein [Cryobacterium sp. 5B3]MEB0267160.1 hypothetical protein [Cryobacterium sp. 10I5]MEB0274482.1 hypothetical protein [Cryobacterium sp. 5B3]